MALEEMMESLFQYFDQMPVWKQHITIVLCVIAIALMAFRELWVLFLPALKAELKAHANMVKKVVSKPTRRFTGNIGTGFKRAQVMGTPVRNGYGPDAKVIGKVVDYDEATGVAAMEVNDAAAAEWMKKQMGLKMDPISKGKK